MLNLLRVLLVTFCVAIGADARRLVLAELKAGAKVS
jgi:hypothetical protein